jgi:predicted ATPase
MKIRHIKIENFRGIKELDFSFPKNKLICFIGQGDSTKSTILKAIQYTFHPYYYIKIDDSDFHECDVESPIVIEITIGELSKELTAFKNCGGYGDFMRGWDKEELKIIDEPDSGLENALTIQFKVDKSLEPKWKVVNDRNPDGENLRTSTRTNINVSCIGDWIDRDLTWSKGSVLTKLNDVEKIGASLAEVSRTAQKNLDQDRNNCLESFDETASKVETAVNRLGIKTPLSYKAHLDIRSININESGLALHDKKNIPLRQLGLGSKRMVICAMQQENLKQHHITLIDELENGLEPHRIARLIKYLKEDELGQYLVTTHSPVVLRELTILDLHIVHENQGKIEIIKAALPGIEDLIQGNIRSQAEAFLSKKIIVCEGATEVGLCRGLDLYWSQQGKCIFSLNGTTCFDANGANKIRKVAENLKKLKYEVAVLADSDSDDFSENDSLELKKIGVDVFKWEEDKSIEQQIFNDLPWEGVRETISYLTENGRSEEAIKDSVKSKFIENSNSNFQDDINNWLDSSSYRESIALVAKEQGWFKKQSLMEEWFQNIIVRYISQMDKTKFTEKIKELKEWIKNE